MSYSAIGVIILVALALLALGAAALVLGGAGGAPRAALAILLPASLVAGAVVAMLLGYRPTSVEEAAVVPVGVGLVTALGTRSPGYGLLAGLVVSAAMV